MSNALSYLSYDKALDITKYPTPHESCV